jgi:hypothetical protein
MAQEMTNKYPAPEFKIATKVDDAKVHLWNNRVFRYYAFFGE